MKKIFYFFVTVLIQGCNNNCQVDSAFKNEFNKHINIIEEMECKADVEIPMSDLRESVFFLSAVTKIDVKETGSFDPENGIFRPENALKDYLKKWKEWYKKNKCTMTYMIADSLYQNYFY